MHVNPSRVRCLAQSNGTAPFAFARTHHGYRGFGDVMRSGDRCYYCAESALQWEMGIGMWDGTYLWRTPIQTRTGSLIYFGAPPTVWVGLPGERRQDIPFYSVDLSTFTIYPTNSVWPIGRSLTNTSSRVNGGIEIALPRSPFTISAELRFTRELGSGNAFGLYVRNRSSGAARTYRIVRRNNSNPFTFSAIQTTANFTYGRTLGTVAVAEFLPYWEFQDDGTNQSCRLGIDGENYLQLYRGSRTEGLTPDRLGIYVGKPSGLDVAVDIMRWLVQ